METQEEQQHKEKDDAPEYQRKQMLSWFTQPAHAKSNSGGETDQYGNPAKRSQKVKQFPEKVTPSLDLPATPSLTNATLFRDDAVEQNKAHHAADVHKDETDYERAYNQNGDQPSQQSRINSSEC